MARVPYMFVLVAQGFERVLVFGGKTGWIGQQMMTLLKEKGVDAKAADSRLENREDVARELDEYRPSHVMNAAGLTGRPNVDWCESHKQETVRVNVIGTLSLMDLCAQRGLHMTNFATGCIYSYDESHSLGSGRGFTEDDPPNFTGSFYSETKAMVDQVSRVYDNVLTLRVRMPISDDLSPRSFITKICKYRRVVDIPNSMSVLHDLLPVALVMSERRLTGKYNFTNPGTISHNQILDLFKEHIDPDFWYENFSEEEQARILAAPRSNNELDSSKLVEAVPDMSIPPIQESIVGVFERMRENLKAQGNFPPAPLKPSKAEMDAK